MEAAQIIAIGLLAIAGLTTLGGIWVMICIHRTGSQRIKIINWIFDGSGDWKARLRTFDQVSFDQHLRALTTFRNPRNLYNFKELG